MSYITEYDDLIQQSRRNGDQLVMTYHVGRGLQPLWRRVRAVARGQLSVGSIRPWRAETIGPNPRCGGGWTRVGAWRTLAKKLDSAGQLDPLVRVRREQQ